MVAVTASYSPSATASKLRRPTKLVGQTSTKLAKPYPISFFSYSSSRANGSFAVRAIDPQKQDQQKDSNLTAFTSQDDLDYLWKLLAGSVVFGGVIKYGSVIFPEITRPNLSLALLMILSPVFIAVLLLFIQSRKDEPK